MNDLIFKNFDKDLEQIANDCLQGKEVVITKFGRAKVQNNGYYQITTTKEGYKGKLLHRLIWEDHYGKTILEGYDIHHINGNKRDNRIQNLQCVEHSKHLNFHKEGVCRSEETKRKIGEKAKKRWEDEDYRKKMSEKMKGKYIGENHPRAKYNLWDISSVFYSKRNMFRGGREPNPCKCFYYKYNGYRLPIGGFIDFITPLIINNFILESIKEEED